MSSQPALDHPAAPTTQAPRTVSLRELNQRSGRVVAQVVSSAQPVTITDRGEPVAQIIPLHRDETPYERGVREGTIHVATAPWDPSAWTPLKVDPELAAQVYAEFMAEREEER